MFELGTFETYSHFFKKLYDHILSNILIIFYQMKVCLKPKKIKFYDFINFYDFFGASKYQFFRCFAR